MSEKGKYRIIEKDVCNIQRKKKFGWRYMYTENSDKDSSYIISGFGIGLLIMSIIFKEYVFFFFSRFRCHACLRLVYCF